ncbi:MAG: hypothetical protein WC479_11680 [Candidatus Izemoplasmatales bacterium]
MIKKRIPVVAGPEETIGRLASELSTLRAELEKVKGENEILKASNNNADRFIEQAGIEYTQLKADNKLLRNIRDSADKHISNLEQELEKVKAELADRDCDTCDCGTCQVRADFATMTKDRDEWRQLSCEQHGDGMVAGTELHMLRQQLMRANEASARDLSALSNQVKSLTIELEAAVEVRRNVTKELTEYGDRACKAERLLTRCERDKKVAIRGNGEAYYKLNLAQQRIRELELDVTDLSNELCDQKQKYYDRQLAIESSEQQVKELEQLMRVDSHLTAELTDKCRELEQQNRKLREENSRFRELIERNLDVLEIGPRAALQEPVSPNTTEHIGDATGMIQPVSPKSTSGTCQPADASDLLKQGFKESGIDVDFVDCTPEKERE